MKILQFKSVSLLSLIIAFSTSCVQDKNKSSVNLSSSSSSCSATPQTQGAIAVIDGKTVTREDLSPQLKDILYKNEYENYSKNKMIFEEFALRTHLAKQQGKLVDPKTPPPLKDLLPISVPSDKEAKAFYEKNKHRMPHGMKFDNLKPQIISHLQQQGMTKVFREQVDKMKNKGYYKYLVVAPPSPIIELDLKNFPTKGNKNAKIKIVEISDYMCGHCQSAHPKVLDILKKYGDKISLTQINLSLRPKGESGTHARGAFCAQKQSEEKFWKYHDETFKVTSVPHDHSKHAPGQRHHHSENGEDLKKAQTIAEKVGLNLESFKKCLNGKEAQNNVETVNNLLASKGISGTPVFIVNNKKLPHGIQELENTIKENL